MRISSSSKGGVAQHFNNLVKILRVAEKLQQAKTVSDKTPDEIAIGVAALQGTSAAFSSTACALFSCSTLTHCASFVSSRPLLACVRIFTAWIAAGEFVLSKAASKKKDKNAALQTLQLLLQQQYKKLWSILLSLLQCDVEAVQMGALSAGMDLMQAEGLAAALSSNGSGSSSGGGRSVPSDENTCTPVPSPHETTWPSWSSVEIGRASCRERV